MIRDQTKKRASPEKQKKTKQKRAREAGAGGLVYRTIFVLILNKLRARVMSDELRSQFEHHLLQRVLFQGR